MFRRPARSSYRSKLTYPVIGFRKALVIARCPGRKRSAVQQGQTTYETMSVFIREMRPTSPQERLRRLEILRAFPSRQSSAELPECRNSFRGKSVPANRIYAIIVRRATQKGEDEGAFARAAKSSKEPRRVFELALKC